MDWNQLILYSNQLELEEGKGREENNSTMQPVSRLFCFISFHRLGYYACFSDHVNYNHLLPFMRR